MNIIITVFIFVIVLFLYLHIYYHYKTSNDLEVFEVSNLSKERFEEVCNLRQPLTLDLDINSFNQLDTSNIEKMYGSFDVKLRDISGNNNNSELYLPVIFNKALLVVKEDNTSNYFSENNEDFLKETSLIKTLKTNDLFLRPPSLMSSQYDYILGSLNSKTPFRYDINYRHFLLVLNGSITVKLAPPKSSKYLFPDKDYDNFEFRSPVNPWNTQKQYQHDFSKIKCLDVTLQKGKLLFIPAYWWNSIQFNTSDTTVLSFKYRTYMNNIAILPEYFKYLLQKQNIKHNVIKRLNTD
jgi:hypothetical protein